MKNDMKLGYDKKVSNDNEVENKTHFHHSNIKTKIKNKKKVTKDIDHPNNHMEKWKTTRNSDTARSA